MAWGSFALCLVASLPRCLVASLPLPCCLYALLPLCLLKYRYRQPAHTNKFLPFIVDLYVPNMGGCANVKRFGYTGYRAFANTANMIGVDLKAYTNEFFGIDYQRRSYAAQGFGQYTGSTAMQQPIWVPGTAVNRHGAYNIIRSHFSEHNTNVLTHGTLAQVNDLL